jgi:hypothetical protein
MEIHAQQLLLNYVCACICVCLVNDGNGNDEKNEGRKKSIK